MRPANHHAKRAATARGSLAERLEPRRLLAATDYFPGRDLGTGGVAHVVADLDRDGTPDVASIATSGSIPRLTIHLGLGRARFVRATSYVLAGSAGTIHAADLDGDERLDLVVAGGRSVDTFRGRGDGAFADPVRVLSSAVSFTSLVAVGDLDGDGRPDLATNVPGSSHAVAHLTNDGAGGFGAPVTHATSVRPRMIRIADLHGDGSGDVVALDSSSARLSIRPGLADGTLGGESTLVITTNAVHMSAVHLRDLDGDGLVDLITASDLNGGMLARLNAGGGTFAPAAQYATPPQSGDLAFGDLDGDGIDDCVTSSRVFGTGVTVRLGAADGTFGPRVNVAAGFAGGAATILDLDGDGANDLLLGRGSALAGRGDGTFRLNETILSGSRGALTPDLNGDGRADLVDFRDSALRVRLASATPSPGSHFGAEAALAAGHTIDDAIAADLDADGRPDLVAAHASASRVTVWRGAGDGTFGAATTFAAGSASPDAVVAGDFDGDGDLDLATRNASGGSAWVLRNLGSATFAAATQLGQLTPGGPAILAADLNGDGFGDLARADATGRRLLVHAGGASGLAAAPIAFAVPDRPNALAFDDLDGDGDRELLVGGADAGYWAATPTAGPGPITLGTFASVIASKSPGAVLLLRDLDGDDAPDLIAAVRDQVSVSFNAGDGTFAGTRLYNVELGAQAIAAADVDLDGRMDLIVNDGGLYRRVLRNDGPFDRAAPAAASVTFDPAIALRVVVGFDEPVRRGRLTPDALVAERIGDDGAATAFAPIAVELAPDGRSATFTLDASLPDGTYRFRTRAAALIDAEGNVATETQSFADAAWFVLRGDANRDRAVNFADLVILAQNYGTTGRTFGEGNVDYSPDGSVGFADLVVLAQRYGTGLPPPPQVLEVGKDRRRQRAAPIAGPIAAGLVAGSGSPAGTNVSAAEFMQ